MNQPILEVRNIYKSFGPTKALVNVNMTVWGGQVVGFVGENGSGKSTLASIVAGIQKCDSGTMFKNGKEYNPVSAVDAQKKGVAMIVQEAGSIPHIGIADNIFVGKEYLFMKGKFVNRKAMIKAAQEVLNRIGAGDIDASASIDTLNMEDRKIVEIARAMYDDPDVLIVDETTTALSRRGRNILYDIIKKMRDSGKAVIFISHDMDEVLETCNCLAVLRDGVNVGELTREEMNLERIRYMMVGRELKGGYYREDYEGTHQGEVVLKCENLTGRGIVKDVSFELHKGEILGIGGLTDCGMHEIGRLLFGIEKPLMGKVTLADGTVIRNPVDAVKKSMGYVSKNRDVEALMLGNSIKNNITLPSLRSMKRFGMVTKKREKTLALAQAESLNIKCSSINQIVNTLSGGNKQKVVFGKWIGKDADILILDCPTRGVDIGVKSTMYKLMEELKKKGKSIVMISEELPELIGMSDRIIIMKNGRIMGEYKRSPEISEHTLIEKMI